MTGPESEDDGAQFGISGRALAFGISLGLTCWAAIGLVIYTVWKALSG